MSIFTHIVSTEHSGSTAMGSAEDYLKELLKQAEESGEEELVLILADYFSMTSLIPFYHACTNKKKYNNKIKPIFGLKITIQADKSFNFVHKDGDFLLDDKGNLIIDNGNEYSFILDGCALNINEDNDSFTILKGRKIVVDESNRLTDDGKELVKKYKEVKHLKPVFYKDHDIIVIAKNEQGRRNINNLVTHGHKIELNSDYKKVNWDELNQFSEGLMMISGGKHGSVETSIISENIDRAIKQIELYSTIFNKEDIYFQIQRVEKTITGQEDEEKIIDGIKKLSKEKGFSIIACNDVRFPKKEHYRDFILRKKAIEKKEMYDPSDIVDVSEEQYFKPTIEMIDLFSDFPEAIVNTVKLTEKTDLSGYSKQLYTSFLPEYPMPKEFDNIDGISEDILKMEDGYEKEKAITDFKSSKYLRKLSFDGLKNRWERICKNQNLYVGKISRKEKVLVTEEFLNELYKKYEAQIELELEVIHRTGFPGYFLIVQDLIRWAKNNDIPVGPGRGSGAGSIVLYCLDITDIDSLEYDLLFERFLNPERVGEPDIDIDFSPRNKKRVVRYMADTYGVEKTAQILTYGTMAAKDVVDNIGRVLGMLPDERNRIKDLISSDPGTKLKDELDPDTGNEQLIALKESSSQIEMILDSALELEGATKSYGKHAGGVVVSFGSMDKSAGLYQEAKEQGVTEDKALLEKLEDLEDVTLVPTVQIDKNLCETVGLIKFDLLGLKNLDVIDDCIKFLAKNNEEMKNFKASDISPHDKKALSLFKEANTYGIFQFVSPSMRRLMKQLQPETFAEVVALVALFRPGPLQSGMAESFVKRKHGEEKLIYPHNDLSELLKNTYGTIIYQEQVMTISRILAGFTRGEADTLRKAMGKKIIDLMNKMRKYFAEGAGHKYREQIKITTSEKWKSVIDPNKTLEIDINLEDLNIPYVMSLIEKENDEEYIEKMISKFGYYGKYISTKEQVLSILKEYANISDEDAVLLDGTIDLMKDHEFLKDYRQPMIDNGIPKLVNEGFSKEEAEKIITRLLVSSGTFVRFNVIFSTMNEFAAYGFNESHSVAYATVSMQTAYLKAHFPSQYMAALISNDGDLDSISITARECRRMGVNIIKPNINKSKLWFEALSGNPEEKNILYGLGLIKGIAKKAKPIIERRNEVGKIRDIYEFYNAFSDYKTTEIVKRQGIVKEQNVKVINKTVLNGLMNSGAFDALCPDKDSNYRPMLLATYNHIDNTLTDLKKRLKKNFTEIKRKLKSKKEPVNHNDLILRLEPTTIEYLGIKENISLDDFINILEDKLNVSDFKHYNTDPIFDIYNKIDYLNVYSSDLFDDMTSLLEKVSFKEDLNAYKNAINEMKVKLKGLSLSMINFYAIDTISKLDKSIKYLQKDIAKKTIKPKEKDEKEMSLKSLLNSSEYLFSNLFIKMLDTDNNDIFVCEKSESFIALSNIESKIDNISLKLRPIFNLKEELKTSHSGDDIEIKEYNVNGISNYYVTPTSKEIELVPLNHTKERAEKEYEVTGMYHTTHPLIVEQLNGNEVKDENFNISPLGSILPFISSEGRPTAKNPNKHYLDAKIAGVILEINDSRMFNEREGRMETKITLVIDDGTGFVTAQFAAEDIFTSGREAKGLEMLLAMKKKKSDILLLEGALTQGQYESQGAVMYVNKIGALDPNLYLPVEVPDLNRVEVDFASPAQINFVKSLLKRKGVNESDILKEYNKKSINELSKNEAGELITLHNN